MPTTTGVSRETPALRIVDERTSREYRVPISEGSVPGGAFAKMTAENKDGDGGGLRIFDPAYTNTAVVRSKICFIDGERGILEYRGYGIEELAEKSTFIEVAYLLIYGELPTKVRRMHDGDHVLMVG